MRSFDPASPGARRLARLAVRVHRAEDPVAVEVLRRVIDVDGGRILLPGQHALLPRRFVDRLAAQGDVRPALGPGLR